MSLFWDLNDTSASNDMQSSVGLHVLTDSTSHIQHYAVFGIFGFFSFLSLSLFFSFSERNSPEHHFCIAAGEHIRPHLFISFKGQDTESTTRRQRRELVMGKENMASRMLYSDRRYFYFLMSI